MTTKTLSRQESFAIDTFAERHYTLAEIANMWSISREKARRIFQDEPGVVRFHAAEAKHTRDYCIYRVPESVARRVRLRMIKF